MPADHKCFKLSDNGQFMHLVEMRGTRERGGEGWGLVESRKEGREYGGEGNFGKE